MNKTEETALEYYDCIMTCEIAVKMAQLYGEYPNRALRQCCKALCKRIKDDRVRRIIKHVGKQNYPLGALAKIRREFDSVCC